MEGIKKLLESDLPLHDYFKLSVEYEYEEIRVVIICNMVKGGYVVKEILQPDAVKDNPQNLVDQINRMCEYILEPTPTHELHPLR